MQKKILVTGSAGFIGFHIFKRLENEGFNVLGVDNITNYYDIKLKHSRLNKLGFNTNTITENKIFSNKKGNRFIKFNLNKRKKIAELFKSETFDIVCHLAAQPGVRYSMKNPYTYVDNNISAFLNILEGCRNTKVQHLVYASSSSVYGANKKVPFSVADNVDCPISLYAATKKSNELMAHCYSHVYNLPTTGLRFFTVYGPWGRTDMALYKFVSSIVKGTPIDVYNLGDMKRDFTYIDDIVEGVFRVISSAPLPKSNSNNHPINYSTTAPYRIYNIGNGKSIELMQFLHIIETTIGKKAIINYKPLQHGDMHETWADTFDLKNNFKYKPRTSIVDGIRKYVSWYQKYYQC